MTSRASRWAEIRERPRHRRKPHGRVARRRGLRRHRHDSRWAVIGRRRRARGTVGPGRVDHLTVTAPTTEIGYFEDVPRQDSLFRYVARAILKVEPTRENKADLLARLRDQGVFLIDLKQDPVHGGSLAEEVPGLVRRVHALAPMKIIVIKTSVFDLVRDALLDDGLPLVDERVPFPGSGQQRRFEASFARALRHRPRAHHQ